MLFWKVVYLYLDFHLRSRERNTEGEGEHEGNRYQRELSSTASLPQMLAKAGNGPGQSWEARTHPRSP